MHVCWCTVTCVHVCVEAQAEVRCLPCSLSILFTVIESLVEPRTQILRGLAIQFAPRDLYSTFLVLRLQALTTPPQLLRELWRSEL